MSQDREIGAWLAELGYGFPAGQAAARGALEGAGLTRAGKQRMSDEKLPRARQVLSGRFFLHCGSKECAAFAAASGREPVQASRKDACGRCGGSDNQRAETEFLEACRRRAVRRVVVVGGSPAVREELEGKLGAEMELRLIDGTERRTGDKARGDLEWADLVLVWGGSELHHKVSTLYTSVPPALRRKVVHVARRGVAALLAGAVEHLGR
ncbi:MAG TPA: hypothetical protein VND93_23920 [Myxococcales bacterium]|nr:hypothetical protein [Myxococcales bacterium]